MSKRILLLALGVFVVLRSPAGVQAQDATTDALADQYNTCFKHNIPANQCTPGIYAQLVRSGQEKRDWSVKSNYDRFKDVTTVTSQDVDMLKSGSKTVRFNAFYVCPKQTHCRPEAVELNFYASADVSDGWQYIHDHDLDLLADGKRFSPDTSWDGEVDSEDFLFEPMHAEVRLADFVTLIKSHNLEARLGGDELPFNGDAKDALRALSDSMGK